MRSGSIFHLLGGFLAVPLLCGAAFVFLYVTLIAMAIPQMPPAAQRPVAKWMNDIPQDSEYLGPAGSTMALGNLGWKEYDYVGEEGEIVGVPFEGKIRHWSGWYDKPLLGCKFEDPAYISHTGVDFPVYENTPILTTMGGVVVYADDNGPWGGLVVVQNGDYQTWYAHLNFIHVIPGQVIPRGDVVGLSGNTGNSSGPHLHYAVQHRRAEGKFDWLDPQMFLDADSYYDIGCGD